jgi:hypothetical protein
MRLYYFTSERYGLEAIRDRRLKVARVNEANDPFELMGLALKRKEDRKTWTAFKTDFDAQFGMICLSADWQHPLLWGHYADKHRGICLGFDVPATGDFAKVNYRADRPTLKGIKCKSISDLNHDDIKELLFLKFKAWEYESEYRAFCTLEDKDPVTGLYFLPFSDKKMNLVKVIIGERSSVKRHKLAEVLGTRASTVRCFKARAGFKKFEVVENKLRRAWR